MRALPRTVALVTYTSLLLLAPVGACFAPRHVTLAKAPDPQVAAEYHGVSAPNPSDRIAALVLLAQPKRGAAYAARVADAIRVASIRTGVDPDVITTTAYVESEFRMAVGPCEGVMQLHMPTLRYMKKIGKVPAHLSHADLSENVQIGAWELKRHYDRAGKLSDRSARLRSAWGRYNGSGPSGSYAKRCLKVLGRIEKGSPEDWRKHIARNATLWTH
jgi:soluble lytic murein transglycosylase-like protein